MRPRPTAQNVLNFMQFFGKFGNFVCPPTPGKLAPPPTENPGSAPDRLKKTLSLFNLDILPCLMVSQLMCCLVCKNIEFQYKTEILSDVTLIELEDSQTISSMQEEFMSPRKVEFTICSFMCPNLLGREIVVLVIWHPTRVSVKLLVKFILMFLTSRLVIVKSFMTSMVGCVSRGSSQPIEARDFSVAGLSKSDCSIFLSWQNSRGESVEIDLVSS